MRLEPLRRKSNRGGGFLESALDLIPVHQVSVSPTEEGEVGLGTIRKALREHFPQEGQRLDHAQGVFSPKVCAVRAEGPLVRFRLPVVQPYFVCVGGCHWQAVLLEGEVFPSDDLVGGDPPGVAVIPGSEEEEERDEEEGAQHPPVPLVRFALLFPGEGDPEGPPTPCRLYTSDAADE